MRIVPGILHSASAGGATLRDLTLPREHGSWSLALEPLGLALLAMPSVGGGWLAVAVVAAFFARRPMRIGFQDSRDERRSAARALFGTLAFIAVVAFAMAVWLGGWGWTAWLVPSVVAGAVFLVFDLRNDGREETAEIAGSAAFAMLPAAFAALAGAPFVSAGALAAIMCARAVPTVLTVRAALRAAKTGVRRAVPAVAAAIIALGAGIALAAWRIAPWLAPCALALFAVRSVVLLVFPRPVLAARTIGTMEAIAGVAFVLVVAAVWPA